MPEIISFEEAIEQTRGKDRSLLLGNGFSIEYFSYNSLLEESGLDKDEPLRRLFETLGTYDFESVVRALEDAGLVEKTYGNDPQAETFQVDADRLREALVHAVRETHPAHREDIAEQIPSCVLFLKNFSKLFTLNYDLLLYWVQLEAAGEFKDGFGLGTEAAGFLGPFKESAYCNTYNLHGGLHLFKTVEGEVEKRLMGPSGVIDAIASTITEGKRLPLYVAEGTSQAKLAKINSVPYLRHCYDQLADREGSFFIYGHSADQNDAHIYRALFKSEIEHIYFFIHRPTADLNAIDGELARYKRLFASGVDYSFVDSESARIWNYVFERDEDR